MRRSLATVLGLIVVLGVLGCDPDGEGRVDVDFAVPECPPGDRLSDLEGYGWDAGFLATERFLEVLIIQVQEFRVDTFETDSVGIRLDLEGLVLAGMIRPSGSFYTPDQTPLSVRIGDARDEAQVVLSLFRTCERFPGFTAIAGEVVFDEFRVRTDGEDTGDDEVLIGRVRTATLSYTQAPAPVGVLSADFNFEPPRRPLREFE